MPKRWSLTASGVAVTAASDLLQINGYQTITDGASTHGTKVVTSASNLFTRDMIGKSVYCVSATGTGFAAAWNVVLAFTSAGSITLLNDPTDGTHDITALKMHIHSRMIRPVRWWWKPTDNTLATAQGMQIRIRRLPALVTDGGGTALGNVATTNVASPTIAPIDPSDVIPGFSAISNSTSKATTSNLALGNAILFEGGDHLYNGMDVTEDNAPAACGNAALCGPEQALVFELLSAAIQGTVHLSYGAIVEEAAA